MTVMETMMERKRLAEVTGEKGEIKIKGEQIGEATGKREK
jgi:hypothetical protein